MQRIRIDLTKTLWAVAFCLVWAGTALAQCPPSPFSQVSPSGTSQGLYYFGVLTNFTVTTPTLVTMNFGTSCSYYDASGMSGQPLTYVYTGTAGPTGFNVIDPNGNTVGWLSLNVNVGPAAQYGGGGANVTGYGNSINITTDGPYAASAGSTNSNVSFSGSAIPPAGATFNNAGGTYSLYVTTPGTYSVTEYGTDYNYYTGQGDENNVDSQDAVNIYSEWTDTSSYIGISQVTESSSTKAPSGSISVSKNAEGAGGVTLNWSITPPPSQ